MSIWLTCLLAVNLKECRQDTYHTYSTVTRRIIADMAPFTMSLIVTSLNSGSDANSSGLHSIIVTWWPVSLTLVVTDLIVEFTSGVVVEGNMSDILLSAIATSTKM